MSDYRTKAINRVYRSLAELDEPAQNAIIDKLKHDGMAAAIRDLKKTKTVHFGDLFNDVLEKQETFAKFEGMRTGLSYFDHAIMGLRGGETIVVAGPSNLGKTMVSLNIVASMVEANKQPVLIISMEMPAIDIASRLYNMVDREDTVVIDNMMENIIIQTELDVNTKHIAAMISKHKPRLVMIDHIQFLANQEKGTSEFERLNLAIKSVQRLAVNNNIPIIVISHVAKSRSGKDGRASVADLKGSSSIEQDSDIVFILNRDKEQRKSGELEVELVKHRKKQSSLYYRPAILKFNGVRLDDGYTVDGVFEAPTQMEFVDDPHKSVLDIFDH